jgi:hypothetical protein
LLARRFAELRNQLKRKTLLVVILDATWSCARKMLRLSPSLQELDRVMLTPASESRYVIKHQPQAGCLSTLESVHEQLAVLDAAALDSYDHPERLAGAVREDAGFPDPVRSIRPGRPIGAGPILIRRVGSPRASARRRAARTTSGCPERPPETGGHARHLGHAARDAGIGDRATGEGFADGVGEPRHDDAAEVEHEAVRK